MKKRTVLIVLAVALLLTHTALAMSSTGYRLDWFTPLTSNGGGPASSTHYAVDLTIGQTAIGLSSSTNYMAGVGYWYGILQQIRLFLPVVLGNFH